LLIVFGGLPGTGKTTVSRIVADRLTATYLRIDAIEQAILSAQVLAGEIGATGYIVANAIAKANLSAGRTVVADCVNPVDKSRDGWRAIADGVPCRLLEVEISCSDSAEHRRRVETRIPDIAGHIHPSWRTITSQTYEPWDRPRLFIDTADLSVEGAVGVVLAAYSQALSGP
jgi:predicted kinase